MTDEFADMESGDYGDVLFIPGYVSPESLKKYFSPLGSYDELMKKYNYLEHSKYIEQMVYGVPSSAYLSGIIYNKDVFYQAGERQEDVTQPFQMKDRTGDTKWYKMISHVVYDSNEKPQHLIGKLINVQKEIAEIQQMENKAHRDPLTGIYNREGFQCGLDAVYKNLERNLPITIAVMDFDGFKGVNDTLGHAGGDEALKLLADTLSEIFDKNAIVSRYGGDEFMLCIYNTDEETVKELFEKLVKTMDREFSYQTLTHKISISVGAVMAKESVSFGVLYEEADKVLYYTKNHGKMDII